ncbi:hypothetical protein RHGRI_024138 [Rhododendron griersonianum]|uniref:Uncharacterized protein n=1 Tax=Rhododendron griersonianum TaxID=479676 RepID=A0AAV6J871_9ERIC|nr:hypothetical protein RHGRI_024138 [Rhododendron griersonianum]
MAKEACGATNADRNAQGDVAKHSTRNHACSSATNVAQSACVFPMATTGTRVHALATTTGRPRKEAPNALRIPNNNIFYSSLANPFKSKGGSMEYLLLHFYELLIKLLCRCLSVWAISFRVLV